MNRILKITDHFSIDVNRAPEDDLIACSHCGLIKIDDLFWAHMEKVETLRIRCGFGIRMTCGYRCKEHNDAVGEATNSLHLHFATDLQPWKSNDNHLNLMCEMAASMDFDGIGKYDSFVHLDSRGLLDRPQARWDYRSR